MIDPWIALAPCCVCKELVEKDSSIANTWVHIHPVVIAEHMATPCGGNECPTCGTLHGFHTEEGHAQARDAIPHSLTWPSKAQQKREQKHGKNNGEH